MIALFDRRISKAILRRVCKAKGWPDDITIEMNPKGYLEIVKWTYPNGFGILKGHVISADDLPKNIKDRSVEFDIEYKGWRFATKYCFGYSNPFIVKL